jgi:hypothetical protein
VQGANGGAIEAQEPPALEDAVDNGLCQVVVVDHPLETVQRFGDGRDLAGWDPPQGEDWCFDRLEPFLSVAKRPDVRALVDVLLERIERLPHRHVDRHALVRVWPDRRRVAVLGLQAPHEAWAPIRDRVDRIELRAEAVHDRIVDRRAEAADVHLREMESDAHCADYRRTAACRTDG